MSLLDHDRFCATHLNLKYKIFRSCILQSCLNSKIPNLNSSDNCKSVSEGLIYNFCSVHMSFVFMQ